MSIKYKNNGTWVESPVNVIQKSDIPEEAFTITGGCDYRFAYGGWDWFINEYGNKITTSNITYCTNMFKESKVEEIPFELNYSNSYAGLAYLFCGCGALRNVPKINNCRPSETSYLFNSCYRLRYLPEDIATWFDWTYRESQTSGYSCNDSNMFSYCYSLRSIPMDFLAHGNPAVNYIYNYFYSGFYSCFTLDELVGLPIPYTATWNSNAFSGTFRNCFRLKNLTFALDPETNAPYVRNWKSQTIDLSDYVGYCGNNNTTNITNYNSGITADKQVTDDATYQALKNDPDWFASNIAYSRYNHDSAVATINSLPDTSAYLASAGGTNTIKFKGESGSATDGGAINTLTEEEIAVATAKGWTVTLA